MTKQAFKVCFRLFIVLALLANCSIFAKPFDQSYAPAASESENKSLSPESLPVLLNPDSSIAEAEAVAETPDIGTKSDDPPAVETKKSTEDVPAVETKEDDNVSQENLSTEVTKGLTPGPALAYVETPAPKTSDDGSFIPDNQSAVVTYFTASAPETKGDPDITIVESQNPENIANGHDSPPTNAVPAPSEALSFPLSEPPTIDEEGFWNVVNGVMAGVLVVGACAIGVLGGFVYQKRKKDDIIRVPYQCLDKKISL